METTLRRGTSIGDDTDMTNTQLISIAHAAIDYANALKTGPSSLAYRALMDMLNEIRQMQHDDAQHDLVESDERPSPSEAQYGRERALQSVDCPVLHVQSGDVQPPL